MEDWRIRSSCRNFLFPQGTGNRVGTGTWIRSRWIRWIILILRMPKTNPCKWKVSVTAQSRWNHIIRSQSLIFFSRRWALRTRKGLPTLIVKLSIISPFRLSSIRISPETSTQASQENRSFKRYRCSRTRTRKGLTTGLLRTGRTIWARLEEDPKWYNFLLLA